MASQLQPIDLVAPGFRGLNLSQANTLLSPEYATIAQNMVVDNAGRLAARKGYSLATTTPIGGSIDIKTLHEFVYADSAVLPIVAYDGGISNSISDPANNDISGTVDDADGRWQFQNFNNKVIGFQAGQKPIVYTGTGAFANIVELSGSAPTGGIGLAAFGRVWGLDSDKTTIKYCALLDETTWDGDDTGEIDTLTLWTDGTDEVTAIAAFNATLLIFGKRHIIAYVDGHGSALGIDPTTMYVVDIITGTGCVSNLSVQAIGKTDILFFSKNGVQSLRRLIDSKSSPIQTLTKLVRDQLILDLESNGTATIRSAYSPVEGFYILSLPTAGVSYIVDTRHNYQDATQDELSIITTWTLAPTAMVFRDNNDLLFGDDTGVLLYGGETSDNGAVFRVVFQSPWLDLGEEVGNRLKILKRLGAILFISVNTDVVFKWYADFSEDFKTKTLSITDTDTAAEWGLGEWGISEWGGGVALRILKLPARITGQYFRIGIEADVAGQFAIQQAELFAKIGRVA